MREAESSDLCSPPAFPAENGVDVETAAESRL